MYIGNPVICVGKKTNGEDRRSYILHHLPEYIERMYIPLSSIKECIMFGQ
jgi:hypothetical protein